ncbi:toxin-antitoxin system HicB family antitoxin [Dryocola clanedunensis]|uniref:toxin-antitoxin system HicB family antitoxin n=1 Tax=Cedecea sulfonylureivorans TaxID=3051154 RepID=UPI001927732D|nr:toxin-antitoxin system HicB family antitoxin [Cedecea sulfonylureivorans]
MHGLYRYSYKGIEPYKSYSGKISARLSPEDHAALERIAQASGESINQLLNQGVKMLINRVSPDLNSAQWERSCKMRHFTK